MTDREKRRLPEAEPFPYEDIVDLPHPVSRRHVQMPLRSRAAQFAPFAALTGYDEAIEETARRTEAAMEEDLERSRDPEVFGA